jgi:hypothetical protein
MSDTPKGWQLLHSALPKAALRALPESVYNVAGLTDVNEGYLIQRLFASELSWEWRIVKQEYLGHEDRTSQSGKSYRVYLAAVQGVLSIDGREFHGSGAHDNRKIDASYKGAATVAFKNASKLAGLMSELFLNGRAMDFIYESAEKNPPTREASDSGTGAVPPTPHNLQASSSAPPPRPEEILEKAKSKLVKASNNGYALEDAVCPRCGRKEALRPVDRPKFCQKSLGGCGAPAKGDAWDLISYGEWRERHP